jgi:cytochrome c peroxidase
MRAQILIAGCLLATATASSSPRAIVTQANPRTAVAAKSEEADLGRRLFFDPALSSPAGQACADCHAPHVAFRDPESDQTTSAGVLDNHFGARNAPTIMYGRFVPELHRDAKGWIGGMFWDGRGGSLETQAGFPLLNSVEMNNPGKQAVVDAVSHAGYGAELRAKYGDSALGDTEHGFASVSHAIAAFERTPALSPFTSRYDRYLRHEVQLTPAELRGLAVFEDPSRGNCASCHPSRPGADGSPPLFTDFRYANLGIPRYANNRFYEQTGAINPQGTNYVDHGLMTTVGDAAQDGKFRTPTLRNIARTGPYGHNGYFENLPYMLDFLNTRDTGSKDPAVKPWGSPEVAATVDQHVGHLGLIAREIDDLEEFLDTLTDELPAAPPPIPNPRRVDRSMK